MIGSSVLSWNRQVIWQLSHTVNKVGGVNSATQIKGIYFPLTHVAQQPPHGATISAPAKLLFQVDVTRSMQVGVTLS